MGGTMVDKGDLGGAVADVGMDVYDSHYNPRYELVRWDMGER